MLLRELRRRRPRARAPSSARWTRRSTTSRSWSAATRVKRAATAARDPERALLAGFPGGGRTGRSSGARWTRTATSTTWSTSATSRTPGWSTSAGSDWFEYERQTGVGPILAATQARFRKPLTYPDTIWVTARVVDIEARPLHLEHRIVSKRLAAVAAEGKGTVVTYHYGEGRKVAHAGGTAAAHRGAGGDGAESVNAHGRPRGRSCATARRNVNRCTAART